MKKANQILLGTSHNIKWPAPVPGPPIGDKQLEGETPWPYPPEVIVRFWDRASGYIVDIEVAIEDDNNHQVTGVLIRSAVPTTKRGTKDDPWKEGGHWDPVNPHTIARMPLASMMRAAIPAALWEDITPEGEQKMRSALESKGVRRDIGFYIDRLEEANKIRRSGGSPAAVLAQKYGVKPNTVYQWLHRARTLTRTDPATTSAVGSALTRDKEGRRDAAARHQSK